MTTNLMTHLRAIPLFAELPAAALTTLAKGMTEQSFAPEQWIVREGEPGDSLYIITHGTVSVLKSSGGVMMELLDLLRTGDIVGEMSLFLQAPRSASVQAIVPTTCAVLTYAHFENFLAQHPKAGQKIYRHCIAELAERLRTATTRLDQSKPSDMLQLSETTDAPAVLPEAFGMRLALIQGMSELLATAPLAQHEQQHCRTVLQEQLRALEQSL